MEEEPPKQETFSAISPDVILFAVPFALTIDILDWFFDIGTIVSIIAGLPLIMWMVWRGGRLEKAKEQVQKIRQRVASRSGRKAQAQIMKRAARRVFRRGILVYVAELIPILNLLPFWLIAVFIVLREK